jgi:hypothetical protein
MEHEFKENLKQKKTWLRGLYMLLFAIFYSVAEIVIFVVVVFQFLLALFTAQTNARLVLFGKSLSTYVYQVLLYLTFNSEDKPFPFGEWPAEDKPQLTQDDDA